MPAVFSSQHVRTQVVFSDRKQNIGFTPTAIRESFDMNPQRHGAGLCVRRGTDSRDLHCSFVRVRSFVNCIVCSTHIAADELSLTVNNHLRRVITIDPEYIGVLSLSLAEVGGRIWVGPSEPVPVIHVLTKSDDFGARNWLYLIESCKRFIRGRTTRASF